MAGWMLLRCLFGPNLQRIHRSPDQTRTDGRTPRRASVLWSLSYYSSPLLLCYLYRKGYICSSKLVPIGQYVGTALVCLLGVAYLRGWGRWRNPEYLQFITILEETRRNNTPSNKKKLACFDFDFKHWPVDFSWKEVSSLKLSKGGVSLLRPESKHRGAADSVLNSVRTLPCHILSYLIVHSFGRRMLYPGSVGLLQKAMRPMLQQGQARLVEEFEGQRNKLVACDGNEIDTMFVDRRKDGGQAGKTLVICCEGNAGFYEVGCMNTPLEGGYSVLGWNHPGFGGSTGVPFPQNEANAMDVVIQFAVHKLGFQLSDIIVYAWSIGGFTASWAVMSYPEIRALVLDASFDDLLPLALKVMPDSWRPLVTHTVRQYMNLNNAEQLCKYQGPVLLIRRTKDEIITTTGPEDITSNRGNDLLLKLLQYRSDAIHTNRFIWLRSVDWLHLSFSVSLRYPKVMTEDAIRAVRQWLAAGTQIEEESVYMGYEVDDDWCLSVLQSYQTDRETLFPWSVGEDMTLEGRRQLALFLARKYMRNFETTHCTPLPISEFRPPWKL
uniref:Protein ABHD16A-like n=1 Tax=Cyprinus carpio TaxID=7962 RepID=A0A8C1ZA23_CYPCA